MLNYCFSLRSGSIYPQDFGRRPEVEHITGHVERTVDGRVEFGDQPIHLMKTHKLPLDERKAIYVVRDGREAVVSLCDFLDRQLPLAKIVDGRTNFGTWTAHVEAWSPDRRRDTLLLRYEDLVSNLDHCIDLVAAFIDVEPKSRAMPTRAELSAIDGHWIRPPDIPKIPLEGETLERFWEINGATMHRLGYQ